MKVSHWIFHRMVFGSTDLRGGIHHWMYQGPIYLLGQNKGISPGLCLWKHIPHHRKVTFSKVSYQVEQLSVPCPGPCWSRLERKAQQLQVKCSWDTSSLGSATCDPCSHAANCSSDEGEGETVILASTEQGRRKGKVWSVSVLWMLFYSVPVVCSERCLDWEIHAVSDIPWKKSKLLRLTAGCCHHFLIFLLRVFLFYLTFLCEWPLSFLCVPNYVHPFSFLQIHWFSCCSILCLFLRCSLQCSKPVLQYISPPSASLFLCTYPHLAYA